MPDRTQLDCGAECAGSDRNADSAGVRTGSWSAPAPAARYRRSARRFFAWLTFSFLQQSSRTVIEVRAADWDDVVLMERVRALGPK